jgi:hypothetical protein
LRDLAAAILAAPRSSAQGVSPARHRERLALAIYTASGDKLISACAPPMT